MNAKTDTTEEIVHILIVDDSPTQVEHLKYILEQHSYSVTAANSGRQALAHIGKKIPALVITDIVMPEMSGYELCQKIKAEEKTKDIPVILLTSLSSTGDVLEGLACGADNFISKPYNEQYLLTNIVNILINTKLRKNERVRMGMEIQFDGNKRFITADQQQMLSMLISTYEAAVNRNKELIQAQNELTTMNERLEDLVDERTAELRVEIAERKQAEEKIRLLNRELEQRIIDRTFQLDATNKELASFAYSVSHDLRAPLRGIDGWSLALLEDYGDSIDDHARKYLDRIRTEAQLMGRLIDDMLNLSRVTSAELQLMPVDLTAMTHSIATRLQERRPDSRIEFIIQPALRADADNHLIDIALTNLFDNAVKFTGKRSHARIEFGEAEVDGGKAFFVRDNGAGFDMAYADKLFGTFQRLHKLSEFPGTGIGLATVQRIIHRHGGRIWAEAKIDEGATFYFTLKETI
jgi:two-component system sensor histidine kinase/response regulator